MVQWCCVSLILCILLIDQVKPNKCEEEKYLKMVDVDQAKPTKSFREIYPIKPKGVEKKLGKETTSILVS